MLIEFKFKNIFSFKEENILSMLAVSNENKELKKNTFKELDSELIKTAIIYGPNASGKTNLLKSMYIFSQLVSHSNKIQPNEPIFNPGLRSLPFMFDTKSQKDSVDLSATFISEGKKYIYSISLSFNKVLRESLSVFYSKKETVLIDRDLNNIKLNMIGAEQWKNSIRENNLAVTVLANFNIDEAIKVHRFFNNIHVFLPETTVMPQDTITMLNTDPGFKSFLLTFLQVADPLITDINQTEQEMIFSGLSEKEKENIRKAAPNIQFNDNTKIKKNDIGLSRHLYENKKIINDFSLGLQNESLGTKQLFNLAGSIYNVVKQGKILCIDEIDKSLHTNLVEAMIKAIHNYKGEKNAQFIFNTHDTNLLNTKTLFRRDQIWFANKDDFGGTKLTSLLNNVKDTPVRKDSVVEKSYLENQYGAVPKDDMEEKLDNLLSETK